MEVYDLNYERRLRQPGEELVLGGITYRLEGMEGKGGNAVMYRAGYEDALNRGVFHQVYIKELFPIYGNGCIYRDEDGNIACREEGTELMEFAKTRFRQGNIANLELLREMPSEISGNINSFEAHGTYYSVLSVHGGEEMQQKLENGGVCDLREAAVILWKILDALECFHSHGLLHLDISPDNILLTPTQALLIDYNSVWLASDIENSDFVFSDKEGYSAPEVMLRNVNCLGKSTDLYSVCAVFFRILAGRMLSEGEIIGNGLKRCFTEGFPILERESGPARHKVMQILAKGLHTLAKKRYQTVKELRAEVRELIDRIDRKGVSIAAIWESSRAAFRKTRKGEGNLLPRILRDKEGKTASLQKLQEQLEEGGLYLLKGAGGMGKTRLLTELWEQGVQKYRPKSPVVTYISLKEYQTARDTAEYIRGTLLRRLDFGRDYEHYEDARHELDKIIDGQEKLILLLDGLNESGSNRELLIKEIEQLGEKPNIAILLTDRTEEVQAYALQSLRLIELLPLEAKAIGQELKNQGLAMPEKEEVAQLLGNPMMLALYKDIVKMSRENHDSSAEEQIVCSADGMVELYLQGLRRTQLRVDAGNERRQLDHQYVIEHLLPKIADAMAQKDRTVLSFDELYKIVSQSCRDLQKNTFGICFREYLGKSRVMLEGITNESEWFDFAVGELLMRDLDLLVQGEGDNYRLLHDSFLPFLAEKGKEQRKLLEKHKNRKHLFMSTLALAVLIPCLLILLDKRQTAKNYHDIEEKARQIQADIEDEKMFSALYGMRELHVSYPKDKYSSYIQEQIGQRYLKAVYRAAFTQTEEAETMGQYIVFDQSEEYVISYDSPENGNLRVDIYDLELQSVRQIILKYSSFSSRRLLDLTLKEKEIRFTYRQAAQKIEVTLPHKKLVFDFQGNLQGEFLAEEDDEDSSDWILESYLEFLSKRYKWDSSYATPDKHYAIGVKNKGIYFSDIEIVNMDTGEMEESLTDNIGSVNIDFTYYDTYGWIMAANNGHDNKLILSGFTIPEDNTLRDFRSFTVNLEDALTPQFLYGKNGMVYILERQLDLEQKNTLHMVTIRNCSLTESFDQANEDAKIDLDWNENCLIPEEEKEEANLNSITDYKYKSKKTALTVSSTGVVHRFGYNSNQYSGVDISCMIEGMEGERLVKFLAEGFWNPYYNEEDQVFGFVDYKEGVQKEAYHLYSYQELVETIQTPKTSCPEQSPDQ